MIEAKGNARMSHFLEVGCVLMRERRWWAREAIGKAHFTLVRGRDGLLSHTCGRSPTLGGVEVQFSGPIKVRDKEQGNYRNIEETQRDQRFDVL